jgi:hypothetical protein
MRMNYEATSTVGCAASYAVDACKNLWTLFTLKRCLERGEVSMAYKVSRLC